MRAKTSMPTVITRAGRAAASRPLTARRAAVLGIALLAAPLAACGSSSSSSGEATGKHLNMNQIRASIEESISKEKHIAAKVTCPTTVEQRKGNSFTCYASGSVTRNGHTTSFNTPFTVEQVNDRGYVEYHS